MRRRWLFLLEMLCLAGLCTWAALTLIDRSYHPDHSVEIKVQLQGARDKAWIFEKDGKIWYQIIHDNGKIEYLSPDDFTALVYQEQGRRPIYQRLLNISGTLEILWVALGLLGQLLFTGRMFIQWLASEKKKESVVPPVFWWMSLIGSSMLLAYFMWRADPIGVLGQAFGWFIYVRNIWLIYRHKPEPVINEDPADSGLGK